MAEGLALARHLPAMPARQCQALAGGFCNASFRFSGIPELGKGRVPGRQAYHTKSNILLDMDRAAPPLGGS